MNYQPLDEVISEIIDHRGITATKLGGDWVSDGVPVISANNLRDGHFVELDSVKHIKKELSKKWMPKKLAKGDVLLVSEGATFGELLFLQDHLDVALGQRLFALRCKDKYNSRFLYYYLKSSIGQAELKSKTTGTSVLGIRQSELLKIKVPDIELDKQNQIASLLGTYDEKIRNNKQVNVLLETICQTIFKHWFIDFEFPDENGEPYRASGGKMKETDLGEIPEGWKVRALKEYVSLIKGVSYRSEDLQDSETVLVTLKCIARGGGYNPDGLKEYIGKYKDEQLLKENDIVVAHTDITQKGEVLGKPAIIRLVPKYHRHIASLDLIITRPINGMSTSYLYYLLMSDRFQNHAIGYANGTTVLHLSSKAIPDFSFALPPTDLINRFSSITNECLLKLKNNENESDALSRMRDILLPKLMSRKIRVPISNGASGFA